jgi:hypothetical protein
MFFKFSKELGLATQKTLRELPHISTSDPI